jgi:GntR family transcriptional repressor for pyruvate dehydrogenase complex
MTHAHVDGGRPVAYRAPRMRSEGTPQATPDDGTRASPVSPLTAARPRRGERSHVVIAEQLRRQIHLGLIPPGAALPPERELTRVYGAGRGTIQQALNLLQSDGLIRRVRGRSGGTFVEDAIESELNLDAAIQRVIADRARIEEAVQFRTLIEPLVVVEACRNRTREDLAAIREAQAHLRGSGVESDFMRHDDAFHAALGRATHNRYLEGAAADLRHALNDAIWVLPGTDVWLARTIREHDAILAAIAKQKATAGAAAARRHTRHTAESIRSLLATLPTDAP